MRVKSVAELTENSKASKAFEKISAGRHGRLVGKDKIKANAKATCLMYYRATGKFLVESAKEGTEGFPGSYILKHGPYSKGGGLTVLSLKIRLEGLGISISKLYDTIMDDLGIEGQTKRERGRVLGKVLQEFSCDALEWFDDNKREAKKYIKALTLDDYYKVLQPYVPKKPEASNQEQPEFAD